MRELLLIQKNGAGRQSSNSIQGCSLYTDAVRIDINPPLLPPFIGKIIEETRLFSLGSSNEFRRPSLIHKTKDKTTFPKTIIVMHSSQILNKKKLWRAII